MTGRFRQSVLVAACAGRLTANWRASAPKQSSVAETLEEMRSAEGRRKVRRGVNAAAKTDADLAHLNLPKTWSVSTVAALLLGGVLRDVKDGNHGANHPKASEFADVGLPFITANCVHDGIIDYRGAPKVRGQALGRLRVGFAEPRDVVLTHKASVGRVAINTEPCVLTPQTTYYRTADSVLAPEYLALFFESIYYYRQLAAVMSQTTRDFVPISEQYLLSVILPPRDEQDEIVRRVTPMLTMAESITARARQASDRIDRASLAVLNKSLRGEIARSQVGLGEPVEGNEPANRAASAGSGPSRVRAKIATQNRGHRGPTRAT
jgi:type I restriction enzyme S subunit